MKEKETNDQERKDPLTPEEQKLMWEKISYGIQKKEKKKKNSQTVISALVVLILGILFYIGYDQTIRPDVYVADNGNIELTLRDGSHIKLLEGGKLTVQKSFPDKTRDVYLEGNAIFKVTHSKEHPFIVHVKGYETKVLGTVFKVIQKDRDFSVELYQGKVAVSKAGAPGVVYFIKPNEQFKNYGDSKVVAVTPLNPEQYQAVAESEMTVPIHLQFSGSRLSEALRVIENTYGITVDYPTEYAGALVFADLKNRSADKVLEIIASLSGLTVKKNGKGYQLEK